MRYWFEFENCDIISSIAGLRIGCGVTAFNYSDAVNIMQNKIFKDKPIPEITSFVEDVDVRTLDQGHVIPNMWIPTFRGIWFPLGYHDN
ncbi:MAG TPA: hypothetical protein VKT28_11555 [Puia sp.]|nr:hypothetical protein [Puia sp.]